MSIFISIASYCDPVLPFTVARALATARHPDRLHFGVVDQSPAGMPLPLKTSGLAPGKLDYLRIEPEYARGPCWARAVAMSFYAGEDWFFQIDSHMDFDADWDETLAAQARVLAPGRAGVVLSAYPDPFTFEGAYAVHAPAPGKVLFHVVKNDAQFAADHPVLGFEAHPVASVRPLPGYHLGAGCLFAPGAFAHTFPYDPGLYFHGEEQALAARLYTHGWDIFHMPGMPVYHLYNNGQSGGPPRPMHWDAAQDALRSQSWRQLEGRSRRRLAELLAGEPLGVYGLGQQRTLAQYTAFCGIDYATRTIAPRAFKPPELPVWTVAAG